MINPSKRYRIVTKGGSISAKSDVAKTTKEATIGNGRESNEIDSTSFEPGQNIFVDEKHAAVIISTCGKEKSALVKWTICQRKDSMKIDEPKLMS